MAILKKTMWTEDLGFSIERGRSKKEFLLQSLREKINHSTLHNKARKINNGQKLKFAGKTTFNITRS
jgi:hypothetical protein